jgi:CysZ protein
VNGLDSLLQGFSLIREPGLRQYVVIPMLINVAVLVGMVSFSVRGFSAWVDLIVALLPDWLSFLAWLVWIIALIVVVFSLFFLFTIVANLIASPFNALLSVKVEERLTGKPLPDIPLLVAIPRSLWREVSKLIYLVPMLIGLMIISIIPLLNVAAPVLWILFSGWMMAIQYCDYAADNNGVTFKALRARLAQRRFQAVFFGLPVYLILAIPLVNLILMPAAVAGGTVFWVRNLKELA